MFLLKLGSNFGGYETTGMTRRIVGVFSEDHTTEPHVSRTSGVADPRELELRQMTEEESSGKLNLARLAHWRATGADRRSYTPISKLIEIHTHIYLHAKALTFQTRSFQEAST